MYSMQDIRSHIAFLNETLVPDLRDSVMDATADDFETCVSMLEQLLDTVQELADNTETYDRPRFKRGQRVIVTENIMRNHKIIDHLIGAKVTISGMAWERGAWWYTIRDDHGHKWGGNRYGDFKAVTR